MADNSDGKRAASWASFTLKDSPKTRGGFRTTPTVRSSPPFLTAAARKVPWAMAGFRFSIGNCIGSLVLLALSMGTLAIAWSMVEEELQFLAGSRVVSGVVVDHVYLRSEQKGPKSHRSPGGYYPVVSFRDESGTDHRVQARLGQGSRIDNFSESGVKSGLDVHALGSTMRVAYRHGQPEDARVLGFGQQYLFPLIVTAIGLALLMFSVLVLRDDRRVPPSNSP